MNRANPAELRQCIESANLLVRAGVRFVPMPATSDDDFLALAAQADERLEKIIAETESGT